MGLTIKKALEDRSLSGPSRLVGSSVLPVSLSVTLVESISVLT
jgi:hypothetical protein